ncbi:MAG: rhodanese-like domain-containing protein [Phototrophicaceae bacterium]
MTITYKSQVRAFPTASPAQAAEHFRHRLSVETDCADVYFDMKHDLLDYVIIDTRSPEAYQRSHVPHAINLPTARITADNLKDYAPDTLFVVYCWGPGCNGAHKAALKLSELGYAVKEMLGGIEYWEDRERYPIVRG